MVNYGSGAYGDGKYGGTIFFASPRPVILVNASGLTYTASPWVPAPSTSGAVGTMNQLAEDPNFLYVCTATNSWSRIALSTF